MYARRPAHADSVRHRPASREGHAPKRELALTPQSHQEATSARLPEQDRHQVKTTTSPVCRPRKCSANEFAHKDILCTLSDKVGPVRTKARGGAASACAPARKEREKPKTAEELDQELDAFMKDEITAAFSCQALVSR